MKNVAIMGFGVVGHGVAELLTENAAQVTRAAGDEVCIKRILDLRDFPDSPFASLVTHRVEDILNDDGIDTVIEVMGGSHPAYEYTVAALKAGKNVITSNKEAVANFGSEFLRIARENGVVYRFEASVGGGIPVISPLISMLGQNRITEVRGILNGTTNYILTKMFTFGDSFENALSDAQAKGYAERNPDADVLGTDACRKIAILSAIVTGKAVPTEKIPTQGITGVTAADVKAAEALGCVIRLLGRARFADGRVRIGVSPCFVPNDSPLSAVSGVYNAVEVIGDPLGNVMLYGKGAGAGATASAVVGDLMLTYREGIHYAAPEFTQAGESDILCADAFDEAVFLRFSGKNPSARFPIVGEVTSAEGEYTFVTEKMSASALEAALNDAAHDGAILTGRYSVL